MGGPVAFLPELHHHIVALADVFAQPMRHTCGIDTCGIGELLARQAFSQALMIFPHGLHGHMIGVRAPMPHIARQFLMGHHGMVLGQQPRRYHIAEVLVRHLHLQPVRLL